MFAAPPEEEFVNDIRAGAGRGLDRARWRPLLVIALMTGAFLIWAALFEIEEVTRGTGRVVPSSQVQVVQSLEGGIVQSIDVAEGDRVVPGQVLLQIDDTRFQSLLGELREQESALLAERTRLQAEAALATAVHFDPALTAANPLAVAAETELFLSRQEQLRSELAVLGNQLEQRQSELAELEALQLKRSKVIAPLSEERALTEALAASGAVPRIELLRLDSRLAELEGDLAVGAASRVRLRDAIEQAESELDAARSAYVLTARQRLARLQAELAVVGESLRAADDRVARTQLRAPVRGTVNRLLVTTRGEVVQPGAPLAEIVPLDDGLMIEADLLPGDVAFIKPGDAVAVKITAYDYLVYGTLQGEVVRIGADTITDAEGNAFFRVIVRTAENSLGPADAPLPISPGMVAGIDIQTGRKTVLDYLLKPIRRARAEALRER
jgi:adhesin transport system membrane fusion protein